MLLQTLSRLFLLVQSVKRWQFFLGVQEKKNKVVVLCSRSPQTWNYAFSRRSRDGKEMYKKAWCTCRVVVLPIFTFCFFTVLVDVTVVIRELKQLRRPRRQLQKTMGLMIKQQLCMYLTLFSTFLWRRLHYCDVKPPNLTFYGGLGNTTTNFSSSFWTWKKSLRILLQEKSPAFDILAGPNRRD